MMIVEDAARGSDTGRWRVGGIPNRARGFFEAVVRRQSIRRFKSTPVAEAVLGAILKAATRAPSAANLQSYQIHVARRWAVRERLSRAAGNQSCVREAPVVLVFLAHPSRASSLGERGRRLLCVQDATIACAYTQLAATALGLGTMWLGVAIDVDAVREIVGATRDLLPVAVLCLGYPDETPRWKPRRPLRDVIREI